VTGTSDPIGDILRRDPTYPRAAYEFVEESLRLAHQRAGEQQHVSAAELLDAFRRHAIDAFGPLARTVLEEWNVRTTDDVGRIVFRMVEAGEMGRTDDDDETDFAGVYEFRDAFPDDAGAVRLPARDDDDDEDSGEV
jgi:uncharacterized repeat protein (TIGR04138 family)